MVSEMRRDEVARHTKRLRSAVGVCIATIALISLVAVVSEPPQRLRLAQADSLVWILVGIAVLNLVTVMPTYRAMLAGPRRVFAVSRDPRALLAAHFVAHTVAVARVAAINLLGAALFVATGERLYVLVTAFVAAAGCALLWPRTVKLTALIETERR